MANPDLPVFLSRSRARPRVAGVQHDDALEQLEMVATRAGTPALRGFEAAGLLQQAHILRLKGELEAAEVAARRAAESYEGLGDVEGQALALLALGEVLSDRAKFHEFEAVVRKAMALALLARSPRVRARARVLLGAAAIYQGKPADARDEIVEAVETCRRSGDRQGLARSLLLLGRIDHMEGRLREAAGSVRTAAALFEELGESRSMVTALFSLGQMDFERGDLEDARRSAERGLCLAHRTEDAVMQLRCLLLRSQVDVEAGRAATALATMRQAEAISCHEVVASILPEICRVRAQALMENGDAVAAEGSASRGIQTAEPDDFYSQGTTRLARALALDAQGRTAEAEADFLQALERLEQANEVYERGWGHLAYGQFLLSDGRSGIARDHLTRAREAFASLENQEKLALIDSLNS